MLSFIFMCLLGAIFVRLGIFAFKAAWGIGKIFLVIIFLPLTIAFAFFKGLLYIAWPLLVVVGIVSLLKTK